MNYKLENNKLVPKTDGSPNCNKEYRAHGDFEDAMYELNNMVDSISDIKESIRYLQDIHEIEGDIDIIQKSIDKVKDLLLKFI